MQSEPYSAEYKAQLVERLRHMSKDELIQYVFDKLQEIEQRFGEDVALDTFFKVIELFQRRNKT